MQNKSQMSASLMFKKYTVMLIIFMSILTMSILVLIFMLVAGEKRNGTIYVPVVLSVLCIFSLAILLIKSYRKLFVPVSGLLRSMAEVGITGLKISEEPDGERQNLTPVFSEVREAMAKLNSLILLIENLNRNIPFKEVLDYIYMTFSTYIPYTYIGVALIEDDGSTIKACYGTGGKYHKNLPKRLLGYKADLKTTSLYEIVTTGRERIINNLEEYLYGKPVKEYNRILLEEGIRSSITFPLNNNGKTSGIIFFSSNAINVYRKEHVDFLRTLANSIVLSLEKSIFVDDMIVGSIQALARLAEQRDPETGEHIQRIKTYSRIIAELLSKTPQYRNIIDIDYINDIERFSPLHDIGKVGIRDDILLKPGKLTREEFEIMKFHTVYGAWVLKASEENIQKKGRSIFKIGIEIAESHHERWDGTGYPYGRSKEGIPLSARIVAVADVLDALTSKRPYKEPFTFEDSCNTIIADRAKHFDPDIIDVFEKHTKEFKDAYDLFK